MSVTETTLMPGTESGSIRGIPVRGAKVDSLGSWSRRPAIRADAHWQPARTNPSRWGDSSQLFAMKAVVVETAEALVASRQPRPRPPPGCPVAETALIGSSGDAATEKEVVR